MAVGGINQTHIYVLDNNGSWEEQLALNNWYRQLQVSNRNILAATYNETTNEDEVYYFDIENCANTPTQMPSLSTFPSSSIHPTQGSTTQGTTGGTTMNWISPRSLAPTYGIYRYFCSNVSISQTASIPQLPDPNETCYSVDIAIAFDDKPKDSVWDIKRVDPIGSNEVLKVSRGTSDDAFKLRKESVCLTAGVYQFTMHDEKPTGGGLSYPGYYNVSSRGDPIVKGREFFMCNSTTTFALPLTATPSMMPSETASPTYSPSYVPSEPPSTSPTISPTVTLQPSPSPSVSFSPTKTCYWIDIVVVFDWNPSGTSWQLQKMNDSGDYILLKAFTGTSDDRYKARNESTCLEGEQTYRFTINDSVGTGIYAPGHYNITSDGNLIVQGGEFGLGEITSFSVPYVPGSATLTNVTQEPTTPSPTYPPPTTTSQPITPFPTESTSQPTKSLSPTISSPPTTTSYPSSRPTVSSAPTTSVQPTQSPSVSSMPTETCYWIDIVVVYDQYPSETSWNIQQINDSGDNVVLKTVSGTFDDKYKARTESICLEGEQTYQFTINDSARDGIFIPGYYNVTSDGNLIVQGREFGLGEATSFSIPFIPGSSVSSVITQAPTTPLLPYPPQTPPPLTPFPTEPEGSTTPTITSRPQTSYPTYSPETVPVIDSDSSPPVASADSANLSLSEYDLAFVSVLDNDIPTVGDTLYVKSIATQASRGFCSISLDSREVVYEPDPGFTGFDTCVYEACDSVSACDTATLTIIVTSQTTDVASPDSANTVIDTSQTTEACDDIMTKKNCTKSNNNCIWDTSAEGGPECVSSEA